MDSYPADYVAHNCPLYVLSSLDVEEAQHHAIQAHGPKIGADKTRVPGEQAKQISSAFDELSRRQPWVGGDEHGAQLRASFRVSRAQYSLPARKASPQASTVETPMDVQSPGSTPQRVLYSPLSPLAAGSPLHPDGLMTPLWVAKYQHMVPAVFISFFVITSDPNTDSLRDNQLKNEIASIRNSLEDSKYRSRYAVVLVGDGTVVNGPDLEERVINIRRAARLDEKCMFFLDAKTPDHEMLDFATKVIMAMQPFAIEFYRDLTRHARRKRDKGANPSHSLSRLAWLARYEYKLGVFAEFRNESDVAARHYNTAMMALFDSQGPVETTSSWSPRWTEARLWSDTTFIRLIRAQLANGTPTAAVRTWTRHRDRTRDLLERKGKGTNNYGYLNWEARWSRIMADLTRDASDLFDEPLEDERKREDYRTKRVYAEVERSLTQEQQVPQILHPWHFLHHAGYWLRRSVHYTKKRLELALEIPEDDRTPPGQSPASTVARRNESYDIYLSLQPHSEWEASQNKQGPQKADMIASLGHAAGDFQAHDQHRQADQYRLELCQQLMQASQYSEAMSVLRPLFKRSRWRGEHWKSLMQELTVALHGCSLESEDPLARVSTIWELSSSAFAPIEGFDYDLHKRLSEVSANEGTETVHIDSGSSVSCLNVTFSFGSEPAYAGVALPGQLVVSFDAHKACSPLTLDTLVVHFDSNIPSFSITHSESKDKDIAEVVLRNVALAENEEDQSPYAAQTDLTFQPGQTKAFEILLTPEESGACNVDKATAIIKTGEATIEHVTHLSNATSFVEWLPAADAESTSPRGRVKKPRNMLNVQPRPPRMEIDLVGLRNLYYTDEQIKLEIDIVNEEHEEADVELEISCQGDAETLAAMRCESVDSRGSAPPNLNLTIGSLASKESTSKDLTIDPSKVSIDMVLEIRLRYTLPSSAGRKIEKSATADITVIRPFEAVHQVFADYHAEQWPNYFHLDEVTAEGALAEDDADSDAKPEKLTGIISKWQSRVRMTSFATDTLVIETARLVAQPGKSSSRIHIEPHPKMTSNIELASNSQHTSHFTLDVQKASMDEQRPVVSMAVLQLGWRRQDSPREDLIHSEVSLGRLSIASSEPRVLARQLDSEDERTVAVEYIIENPSMHFLTFTISIESSEEFAFSGAKSTTVQLTPLSRHEIKYLFMPFTSGGPIRPDVQIVDVYFNKVLNVIPTGTLRTNKGELQAYANG